MQFERLDTFVRRLAGAYGVGVETFCRYGLGITRRQWESGLDDPPAAVLARLSAGSGLSVRRLRNMTARRSYARLLLDMRRLCSEHPEQLPESVFPRLRQTPGPQPGSGLAPSLTDGRSDVT